jgi:16S rRNA (uracil1498-N3)-methyltransferase
MHRFYLPPEQCRASELKLTGREAHHALHVLRVRAGERVTVLDGAGSEILCEVRDRARDSLTLAVIKRVTVSPLPCCITLLQAIPKGKTFETIIQKATELGVWRIVPILSERTVCKGGRSSPSAGQADGPDGVGIPPAHLRKWQQVAIEAIKQCGSAWLPQIEQPVTPAEFIARGEKFDLPLVASLQPDRRHPRDYFAAFQREHGNLPRSVCVWIGPEGDFTPGELDAIKGSRTGILPVHDAGGALPISLGRLTLRSDTAAIYCLSILNYELQSAGLAD